MPDDCLVVGPVNGSLAPLTEVQRAFLEDPGPTPVIGIDLAVVRERYRGLHAALPGVDLFYAVKANPGAEIIATLWDEGCSFDVASHGEIELCRSVGVTADSMSFGNTIKPRSAIAEAHRSGIELYSFDSAAELSKLTAVAPGSVAMCRLLSDGEGAAWPLSRKFGCNPHMAGELLAAAADAGHRCGIAFHVGSQQFDPGAWDTALTHVAEVAEFLERFGHHLDIVNLGGGFPSRYGHDVIMPIDEYGAVILESVEHRIGGLGARLLAEPGRHLVAEAGVLAAEVLLVSRKTADDPLRWVYIDVGVFTGLIETIDETIRYPILTSRDDDGVELGPCVLAGPTCDSLDVMTQRTSVDLPVDLGEGDRLSLLSAGSYTTSYSSVDFNGFPPLRQVILPTSVSS